MVNCEREEKIRPCLFLSFSTGICRNELIKVAKSRDSLNPTSIYYVF